MQKPLCTAFVVLIGAVLFQTAIAQNGTPYWSTQGNSNATSSSKLGTTNGINLRLFTNNTERVRINYNNGYVGINTTAPNARLHFNTAAGTSLLRGTVDGSTKLYMSSKGGLTVGAGLEAPALGMYVAGNVGVGINTPVRKLQVQNGDIRISKAVSAARYLEFSSSISGQNSARFEHSYSGTNLYISRSDNNFSSFQDIAYFSLAPTTTYRFIVYGSAIASGGTWVASDSKLKTDVADLSAATAILNKLQPKTYFFKQEGYAGLGLPKQKQYGFLAQELEQVLPELVNTTEMPVRTTSTGERIMEDVKAVNYTALIPILVKGMQEQQTENEALKEQVAAQQQQINELRRMVLELKSGTNITTSSSSWLEQNTPNPVNSTTTIRYRLPETTTSALLTLTNAKGQVVKTMRLSDRGSGQANLNTAALAAGSYTYTLYVDGQAVATKRLVIMH